MAALAATITLAQIPPVSQPPPIIAFPEWQPVRSDENLEEFQVAFPSAITSQFIENNTVYLHIALPADRRDKIPVVVVLHYWGANNLAIEHRLALQLARRGIGTVAVELPYHLTRAPRGTHSGQLAIRPDVDALRETITQGVLDVRRTIDWIQTREEFDAKRIGIAGTSLGAIVATLTAGVEPRIQARCFILGGVDLAHLLWNSSRVVSQREEMRRRGYTESRLRTELSDVEPEGFLRKAPIVPSLVVRAKFDSVIPKRSSQSLIDCLGKPQVLEVQTGHFGGVFAENSILRAVSEFFQGTFFGQTRSTLVRTLGAPTLRIGPILDGTQGLQVALAVDLIRFDKSSKTAISGLLSPRGPRLFISTEIFPSIRIGPLIGPRHASGALFWSFVL